MNYIRYSRLIKVYQVLFKGLYIGVNAEHINRETVYSEHAVPSSRRQDYAHIASLY
jgi:hypothetical protein